MSHKSIINSVTIHSEVCGDRDVNIWHISTHSSATRQRHCVLLCSDIQCLGFFYLSMASFCFLKQLCYSCSFFFFYKETTTKITCFTFCLYTREKVCFSYLPMVLHGIMKELGVVSEVSEESALRYVLSGI